MKILFIFIFSIVLTLGNLIFPDKFSPGNVPYSDPYSGMGATAAAAPTEEEVSVISRNPGGQTVQQAAPTPENTPTPVSQAAAAFNVTETDMSRLFGDPRDVDNFERGSSGFGINAGLNDDEGIRIIALSNRISLEPKKNNGWLSWRLRPPAVKDGAAEMDFSITTCARGDRTGLIMHSPDYSSGRGYYFSLACEGTVSILMDSAVLGTADAQPLFHNNSGDTNTLTAVIRGNTLTAILNGETVLSVQDDTYTEGFSGFFTAPQNQDTLTMDISTFRSYYIQN